MKLYQAVINVPGFLPMSDEDHVFETVTEAWEFLASERQRDLEDPMNDEDDQIDEDQALIEIDGHIDEGICGVVYGHTPGYDGDHDLGMAYSVVEVKAPTDVCTCAPCASCRMGLSKCCSQCGFCDDLAARQADRNWDSAREMRKPDSWAAVASMPGTGAK